MLDEFKKRYYTAIYDAFLDIDESMAEKFDEDYTSLSEEDIQSAMREVHDEIMYDCRDYFQGYPWNNRYKTHWK